MVKPVPIKYVCLPKYIVSSVKLDVDAADGDVDEDEAGAVETVTFHLTESVR